MRFLQKHLNLLMKGFKNRRFHLIKLLKILFFSQSIKLIFYPQQSLEFRLKIYSNWILLKNYRYQSNQILMFINKIYKALISTKSALPHTLVIIWSKYFVHADIYTHSNRVALIAVIYFIYLIYIFSVRFFFYSFLCFKLFKWTSFLFSITFLASFFALFYKFLAQYLLFFIQFQ